MKDAFGKEVKAGDKVVYITGYDPRHLSKGKIDVIHILDKDEEYSGSRAGEELANIKCGNYSSKEIMFYKE